MGGLRLGVGEVYGACDGLCGLVLGLRGKGFGLGRGGLGGVILGFGVAQVGFTEWCGGVLGVGGLCEGMGVMFRGLGGCLVLVGICAGRFWAWVGRVLGLGLGVLGV